MSEQIIIFSQIVFIDLILAGDNAIIIGMVASQFKDEVRKKIIFWGMFVKEIAENVKRMYPLHNGFTLWDRRLNLI